MLTFLSNMPYYRHNQDTIYYKDDIKIPFPVVHSILEESVSAVYSDWLRGKSEANYCSLSAAKV